MKFAVITSTKDLAGKTIKEALMRLYPFEETGGEFEGHPVYTFENIRLYTTDKDSIHCENIDDDIDADIFVFATRHRSQSGIPSLSVHGIGNWGNADEEYGGKDRTLCVSPAGYLKEALIFLENNNKTDFEVVQECTHHGPYMQKPAIFIEIGSSEKQWSNKDAADIIAKTIIQINAREPAFYRTAIGIGGLHTTPSFKKIMISSNVSVGHVCPKYQLANLTKELILEAIEKVHPSPAELVILDWKGLGTEKERIVTMLEELGVDFTRTSEF